MMDFIVRSVGYFGLGSAGVLLVAGIVWQFFKWFGAKWMEHRFAKTLETFKHQQAQEIERLRGDIAKLLDRATKLHAQEFDVLPEAWDKLSLAMGKASSVLHLFQQYTDVSKMNDAEFDLFLRGEAFDETQKAALREADRTERLRIYQDLNDRQRLAEAFDASVDFHNYVIQKGIFIQAELREKMKKLRAMLYAALRDARMVKNDGLPRAKAEETRKAVFQEGAVLQDEIMAKISDRLWGDIQGSRPDSSPEPVSQETA